MPKIIIVYYSKSGNTEAMAKCIGRGVEESGVNVCIKPVAEVKVEELLDYQGIIIGSPTYYGTMAWEIKKMIDDSVRLHSQLAGKVAGAFTSSANIGGGNETTIMDILKALLIHGMIVPGSVHGDHYGPVSIGKPDNRVSAQCHKLGLMAGKLTMKLFG